MEDVEVPEDNLLPNVSGLKVCVCVCGVLFLVTYYVTVSCRDRLGV